MRILVDGDILTYRAACSPVKIGYDHFAGKDIKRPPLEVEAKAKFKELLLEVLEETRENPFDEDDYELYITGKGNFRNDYAVTAPYKGNRKEVEKPEWLESVRQYALSDFEAILSSGEEADDLLAMRATELGPENACIASTDKDMLQVNCWHYNITKKTMTYVEPFEGIRWFYGQIIEGDRADNIIGINGIGPKKREKLLEHCKTEDDLYDACVACFMSNGYSLDEAVLRVIENGRLAWLRREVGQVWYPMILTGDD